MSLRIEEWALVTKNIKKRKENEKAQKWALATKIQKKANEIGICWYG